MRPANLKPSGRERTFGENEIIVSKTDTKGRITYANTVFEQLSGYTEEDLLGEAHNIIRHPDMPRCVFKLLWDTIESGKEIFAYVLNLSANGDHYWVFAHVTPSFEDGGRIVGYHSNRRVPDREPTAKIEKLYQELVAIENSHTDWRAGMAAAGAELVRRLETLGITYEEFVFAL